MLCSDVVALSNKYCSCFATTFVHEKEWLLNRIVLTTIYYYTSVGVHRMQSNWLVFLFDGYFFPSLSRVRLLLPVAKPSKHPTLSAHRISIVLMNFPFFFIQFVKWSAHWERNLFFLKIEYVKIEHEEASRRSNISWFFFRNWICNYGLLHCAPHTIILRCTAIDINK